MAKKLNVTETLTGKNILIVGSTGFVGKVTLSMLLYRYPDINRVYALIRAGAGSTAEDRFLNEIMPSEVFNPLRTKYGDRVETFIRDKVHPIVGDIGRDTCGIDEEKLEELNQVGLDCIINSAGLVSFTPSLENAIRINVTGVQNVVALAKQTQSKLLHISTCYVSGRRNGEVFENESIDGYFPRKDELRTDDFNALEELKDCQALIEKVRDESNDKAHVSEFRERAVKQLIEDNRDPDDAMTLRLGIMRQRKLWIHEQLTNIGMERSKYWGWVNTYTYTKSLGEQILSQTTDLDYVIVRPSIVESARRYPFEGWNEGFNTSAPLVYMALKGHRNIVASDNPLDVIPVDYIAVGIISVTAALLSGSHETVYQCGTSDSNPITSRRTTELTALAVRQYYRNKEDGVLLWNKIRARLEAMPVSPDVFNQKSSPQIKRFVDKTSEVLTKYTTSTLSSRIAVLAEKSQEELNKVSEVTDRTIALIELFQPFCYDINVNYRGDNMRALYATIANKDQKLLPWDPETIDWRHYWLNIHFPGLRKWIFPILDDEFRAKPRTVYPHRTLIDLFDATVKFNHGRPVFHFLSVSSNERDSSKEVYSYGDFKNFVHQTANFLANNSVKSNDHVMLMSENRPEWPISYFGILKANAITVPVDAQLAEREVHDLLKASISTVLIVSDKVKKRLKLKKTIKLEGLKPVQVFSFSDILLSKFPQHTDIVSDRTGESVASIVYTSGTTGNPKGVMLTHKNLTTMIAKLSSIFKTYSHDGLLSVLPLHHAFEFSAGLLMPMVAGARITYLTEMTPDILSKALSQEIVTIMVGVPALWQALYRKIYETIEERGFVAGKIFDAAIQTTRKIDNTIPYSVNVGKIPFWAVHQKLGGRLRLLISGASALPPEIIEAYQGLGFNLVEGYGMTESSPVISVQRPGENTPLGSVGYALPGIDVRIDEPDDHGVGEIIVKGSNVMKGYYRNEKATADILKNGWLHTGDLGKLDTNDNLYIVGRKKDTILGASGENVYPDELENLYGDSPYIQEMSVVGVPVSKSGETVACLVVPNLDDGMSWTQAKKEIQEHFKNVSSDLSVHKRIKIVHFSNQTLPKTTTRKIKRGEVVKEIQKLEKLTQTAAKAKNQKKTDTKNEWIIDVIAKVSQKNKKLIDDSTRLDSLEFDSLAYAELLAALDAYNVVIDDPGHLSTLETIADMKEFVVSNITDKTTIKKKIQTSDTDQINVSPTVAKVGRFGIRHAEHFLYKNAMNTQVHGRVLIPPSDGYIVVSNHSSHLDMGLVKYTLAEHGNKVRALAARDYFFADPLRAAYFENFTNLLPMERHGSLRESLELASDIIQQGNILLIFPEGTRSVSGVMSDFKPSVGYLAMKNKCGILPLYLSGTHLALPKGKALLRERNIASYIGSFVSYEALQKITDKESRSDSYYTIASHMERIVRSLAPEDCLWTLGESGREPIDTKKEERVD